MKMKLSLVAAAAVAALFAPARLLLAQQTICLRLEGAAESTVRRLRQSRRAPHGESVAIVRR